ncbi:MAG: hypothetical protein D3908_16205 [Candidatus Electrothrix sp. AUS4]|nr:hypothetical protein [Candidatus Electrothrix sp. AUS4]
MKKRLCLYLIIVGMCFCFGGGARADIDPETVQKLFVEGVNTNGYGYSVAVSGNSAVIGSQWDGEVHIFTRSCTNSSVWQFQQKLLPPEDNTDDGFETLSVFGEFVSIDGDTIIVSCVDILQQGGNTVGYIPGACIYTRSGMTWGLQQKISAYPPPYIDKRYDYVKSVVVDNDTAVVVIGSVYPYRQDLSGNDYGIAYVFIRSGGVWVLQERIAKSSSASLAEPLLNKK